MFSYAVDHCFKYSCRLCLFRAALLSLFINVISGCTPTAMSEPSPPLRLLNSELDMSMAQVNRPLLRRHRVSMKCLPGSGEREQNCVFKGTKALPLSLARRLITEIHYRFDNDQLTQVIGHFGAHDESDGFKERMQQRYGKPSQSSAKHVRWRQGTEQLVIDSDSIRLEKVTAK